MLHKYGLSVAKEEADKVDTLRYTWDKLLSRNTELQNELFALQPKFRGELTRNVETFQEDCGQFYLDYEKVNEMSDRYKIQLPVVNSDKPPQCCQQCHLSCFSSHILRGKTGI